MTTVESVIKDWLNICLERAKISADMERMSHSARLSGGEEFRYGLSFLPKYNLRLNFELETRKREVQTLMRELQDLQCSLDNQHILNTRSGSEIEAVTQAGLVKDSEIRAHRNPFLVQSGKSSNHHALRLSPSPSMIHSHDTESSLGCLNQKILSRISANSSSLSELAGKFCQDEMGRIRMLDSLLEELEGRLADSRTVASETNKVMSQLSAVRGEYDSVLLDDFIVLVDLATTVEHLKAELTNEKRTQKRDTSKLASKENGRPVIAFHESAVQLQAELSALSSQLASMETAYKHDFDKEHAQLSRLKSKKAKAKSEFQQSLKSVFKDFDVLVERLTRSEGTLEKMNSHYQITEEEILTIVSPILETIDGAKARIQHLSADAEAALYDEGGVNNSG